MTVRFIAWPFFIAAVLGHIACRENLPVVADVSAIVNDSSLNPNLAHLEHLYDEIVLPNGDTGGVVWIYCEAPDYVLIGDEDEGYTCVDDMARALVVYSMHHGLYRDSLSLKRVKQLSRTLLSMQAENGYFYNFLWPGDSINTTFRTSVAVPDWWSWRALWALETALAEGQLDSALAAFAKTSTARLVRNVHRDLAMDSVMRDTIIGNIRLPNDLPVGGGADQTAVLMLGLNKHASRTGDTSSYAMLHGFAERLIDMQTKEGQFLSWYNYWHAWGNLQAYALIEVGKAMDEPSYVAAGVREVESFTNTFLVDGRYSNSQVTSRSITTQVPGQLPQFMKWERDTFPQIAYGQRPMIWAALAAGREMQDTIYTNRAREVAKWFQGDNPADAVMYDPQTGRGYDGILSPTKVNYNSGAESTVESLLSLLMLETMARQSNSPPTN